MAIDTLKWNGTAWVTCPVKRWNGSAWVDATVRKWNGSSWVQMYPETVVNGSQYIYSTGTNHYKGSWQGGAAKQGDWGYGECYGYLGLCSTSFTGFGNIMSISGAGFRGTRDGSGYYNNDQTIRFFRSNAVPGYSPVNTIAGEFTTTSGGPGSGGNMTNRWINPNGLGNMLDWVNGVGGKDQAFIYDNSKNLYLGVTNPALGMDYTYMAKTVSFESPYMMLMMTPDMYMDIKGRTPYHSMIIYEDEQNMSLGEIMQRREDGIVLPINAQDAIDVPEVIPWTKEYGIDIVVDGSTNIIQRFKIEILNLRFDDQPEISLDNESWAPIKAIKEKQDDWLYGQLPEDFNKTTDSIYFRIHDKLNDVIISNKTITPLDYNNTKGILLPGNN